MSQNHLNLSSLPLDLHSQITNHLSLHDILNLTRALAGTNLFPLKARLGKDLHFRERGMLLVHTYMQYSSLFVTTLSRCRTLMRRRGENSFDLKSNNWVELNYMDSPTALVLANEITELFRVSVRYNRNLKWPRLTTIPREFGQCKHLRSLDLRDQDMDRVPEAVLQLRSLLELNISGNNRLTKLPTNICARMPNLLCVHVKGTGITSIPENLAQAAIGLNKFFFKVSEETDVLRVYNVTFPQFLNPEDL